MTTVNMALLGVFPTFWQICPSKDRVWTWCNAGVVGTLKVPNVQECQWLQVQELGKYYSFFLVSDSWLSKDLPGWSFSVGQYSRHSKAPMNGVFIASCIRHLKGHPLWGLSLLVSCWCQSVVKEATVISPPHACDSAVSPCLHGCLTFLQRYFLP